MKIVDVLYDSQYIAGCPTCDYGSTYLSDFTIVYEDKHELNFRIEGENGSLLSEGKLMTILANTSDEQEIKEAIIQNCKDIIKASKIHYYSGKLYINDEEVNIDE